MVCFPTSSVVECMIFCIANNNKCVHFVMNHTLLAFWFDCLCTILGLVAFVLLLRLSMAVGLLVFSCP